MRLLQGRFDAETVYSDDPVDMARRWQSEGARWLHVVDLDGAREGAPQQLPIVAEITRAVDIPVQLGGGIRDQESVRRAFTIGVQRVILGSAAIANPDFAQRMFAEWGERIVLGVDARGGKAAIHGWQTQTEVDALELILRMKTYGASRVIYTDIARDGTLKGANLMVLKELVEQSNVAIIASGGIASLEDLLELRAIGVEGAIVGKALYTGQLNIRMALEKVR